MASLQGGRRRRRSPGLRVLRGAAFVALGLAVAAAALLGLMAARASGPTIKPRARMQTRRRHTTPASPTPTRSAYGVSLAPRPERVHVHLKLGLRAGMLFDVQTGEVLWQRHPAQALPIASLTKMMTAVIVAERSRPTDRVLITPAAVRFSGSGIGLLPVHKQVPLLPLLYGLLLPSGNDAAIALAQHVAGTRQRFIAMMNARARELGLGCTHFNSVSGIVDQGNYSCAADLAVMAHVLLAQPLLAHVVGTRDAVLPFPIKGGKLYLYNNNPLLRLRYPGTDGIKTGYTDASGPCLVVTARHGRAWLGVVLLHSADTIDQAEELLAAGFAKLAAH